MHIISSQNRVNQKDTSIRMGYHFEHSIVNIKSNYFYGIRGKKDFSSGLNGYKKSFVLVNGKK